MDEIIDFTILRSNIGSNFLDAILNGDIHSNATGTLANYNYLAARLDPLLNSSETLLKRTLLPGEDRRGPRQALM